MGHQRFCLPLICLSLIWLGVWTRPVAAQTPPVRILDADNVGLKALVDGNSISLQINLLQAVNVDTPIDFLLDGVDTPIASCTIPTAQNSCQTARFPTLGWAWRADGVRQKQRVITARAAGMTIGESAPLAITPRPVVMVHGFKASWKGWSAYLGADGYLAAMGVAGYAVGDGQVPGVMDIGDLATALTRTNTIAQNGAILGEYIRNVQQVTGAEQVDVLAHSMGGMITRYYLDRIMQTRNVAQLIILGSPMGGSSCSVLPAALGLLLPATLELQPSYMQAIFNPQITRRRGVPFHALAGTKLHDAVQSPCTDVASDLVVSLASINAIAMPVQEIALLHHALNDDPAAFTTFVQPLIQTPPGAFWQVDDPPLPSPAPVLQFTQVYTGHVALGETHNVTIHIDPGVTVATFALYDTSRSLTTVVTGANGNTVQLDATANGEIRVTDPAALVYLGYGFVQPRAGQWVVALQTTADTPTTGADYAIAAQFNGGATLQITLDQLTPQLAEPVNLQAQLSAAGQAVTLTSGQARLRRPDGQIERYPLIVQGANATVVITPSQQGLYGVELNVSAQTGAGLTIDRAAFAVFEAQPNAATELSNPGKFLMLVLVSLLVLILLPLLILLLLL